MLYRLYSPPAPLGHFVELLWLYEGFRPAHSKERLLPTGTIEIVFDLREDRILTYGRREEMQPFYLSGSVVCGAHSEFFVIDTSSQDAVLGVHFRPGGAFPFLKLPAGELHNEHVDLGALWGWQEVRDLREKLLRAAKPEQKLRVLERALLGKLREGFERHPAVAYALGEFDAEAFLPGAAFPESAAHHSKRMRDRLGGDRAHVRVLRPGAFHSRFPGVFRDQSVDLSGSAYTAPESRSDSGMNLTRCGGAGLLLVVSCDFLVNEWEDVQVLPTGPPLQILTIRCSAPLSESLAKHQIALDGNDAR
jgi:hypothetical protein